MARAAGGGGAPKKTFAGEDVQGLGERNLFPAGRAVEPPVPAALLDEGGDVGRHARHPARPQGLDACLCDRIVGRACALALQIVQGMEALVVMAQAQGQRVGGATVFAKS